MAGENFQLFALFYKCRPHPAGKWTVFEKDAFPRLLHLDVFVGKHYNLLHSHIDYTFYSAALYVLHLCVP